MRCGLYFVIRSNFASSLPLAPSCAGRYACVIFGNMGGMFLPGYLKETTGTYCASLLMSLCATTLTFFSFVIMYMVHPIGKSARMAKDMF